MWPFNTKSPEQKLADWTNTHCARCGNALGSEVLMHPDRLLDSFLKDVRYCSQKCLGEVAIPKPTITYHPPPEPTHLSTSEQALVAGKSSGGMYFDVGRCANCGQAIPGTSSAQFQFCSQDCRAKAIRPYLPKDFEKQTLQEDDQYSALSEGLDEVCAVSDEDYVREGLYASTGKSRHEAIDALRNKLIETEGKFNQDRINAEHDALATFTRNWEAQRDFVLRRETAKFTEKMETEVEAERQRIEALKRR
jgi:hypothetical protein